MPDPQSATRDDIHDDYHYEALVALIDPKLIGAEPAGSAGPSAIISTMLELLKPGPSSTYTPFTKPRDEEDEQSSRIRCPLCQWQPTPSTVWACESFGTPEPYFGGCGTLWNTFATRGKCPGCSHRWKWTSCHECLQWSLHEDWYEEAS